MYRFTVFPPLPFCTGLLYFPCYLSVQGYCVSPATFLYRFTVLSHLAFCTDILWYPSHLSMFCNTLKCVPYLFLFLQGFILCLMKKSLFFASPVLNFLYRLTENERNSVGRWSSSNTSNHLHVVHHGAFIMEVMVAYHPPMGATQRTAAWHCPLQGHHLLHRHRPKVQLVLQLPVTAYLTMTLLNQQLYQMMLMHWGYCCKR